MSPNLLQGLPTESSTAGVSDSLLTAFFHWRDREGALPREQTAHLQTALLRLGGIAGAKLALIRP